MSEDGPVEVAPEEAVFLVLGPGAAAWLGEATAAGARRIRPKMAEAVVLAKPHPAAEVDQALGKDTDAVGTPDFRTVGPAVTLLKDGEDAIAPSPTPIAPALPRTRPWSAPVSRRILRSSVVRPSHGSAGFVPSLRDGGEKNSGRMGERVGLAQFGLAAGQCPAHEFGCLIEPPQFGKYRAVIVQGHQSG